MADEAPAAGQPQAGTAPSMQLLGQFIRDLSFENPNAPASIMGAGGIMPKVDLKFSVTVRKQNEDYFIDLAINAKAERDSGVMFNIELVYGGAYRIRNVPEPTLSTLVNVECPRLIFPFARQVLASITQHGGFPPLMMEPVDFAAMYRQKLEAGGAASAPATKPN